MGESWIWREICRVFGHGKLIREWHQFENNPPGIHFTGEYITSCERCGMIVKLDSRRKEDE